MGQRNRELFQVLAGIHGKFLLSFDDAPEIRTLCKEFRFKVTEVKVAYTLGAKGPSIAKEVLISNYRLPKQ